MSEKRTVLGLMSGTSLDGVDAAILKTDGRKIYQRGVLYHRPFNQAFRDKLRTALARAAEAKTKLRDGFFKSLEAEFTELNAAAIRGCLAANPGLGEEVSLVGFHGQTLYHDPAAKFSWQLGDGKKLAQKSGLEVVYDFRSTDLKAGGQGAPLAPLYHRALFRELAASNPLGVLNIGGVANLTWLSGDEILAFDIGPGNALLDDWVLEKTGKPYDEDGKIARLGTLREDLIETWIKDPYFDQKPPKSLDRNAWQLEGLESLSLEDGAASLLGLTLGGVVKAVNIVPEAPRTLIVSGGGRHNSFLMGQLKNLLGNVVPVEHFGLDGDAIEAEAFAYLAQRSTLGLSLSLPGTTGVKKPTTGGVLVKP